MQKTNRMKPLAVLLISFAVSATAAVNEQEAAQLGKDLTPVGAERAGNKDGTIPKWEGGLPKGKQMGRRSAQGQAQAGRGPC